MKYPNTIFLLFFSSFFIFNLHAATLSENEEDALRRLDREVADFKRYEDRKQQFIDSLKSVPTLSASVFFEIAEANRKFNIDSALVYYRRSQLRALENGEDSLAMLARLRYVSLFPAAGYFSEAERIFDSISPQELPRGLREEYYKAGNQLYFYGASSVSSRTLANSLARKGSVCTDSLLLYLEEDSPDYLFYRAQQNMLLGNLTLSIADITELMTKVDETDERYAIASSMAAYYFSGDQSMSEHRLQALVQSAISDIKSGRHEMTALQELSGLLYSLGDIERADRYLQLALDLNMKSGARMRIYELVDIMPAISRAAQHKADSRNRILMCMVVALVIAAGVIFWLLVRVYRSRNKLARTQQNLVDSLDVRDRNIRNYLTLCSECLLRLEEFNRVASRKIKAKQVSELYDMIQSGKIVHDEFAKFLTTFDSTFLNIYPDFVSRVNTLLQPDRQYPLPAGNILTPELRILALLRLGIDDSGAIAKFLDLSVNTVYTYRNKIKNRALNRENFEAQIKNMHKIPI